MSRVRRTPLRHGGSFRVLTAKDEQALAVLRHSAAHVLATAVRRLRPDAKIGFGPAIDDGFYYDFEVEEPFTPADLEAFEGEMRRVCEEASAFVREEVSLPEARSRMADDPLKLERMADFDAADVISTYTNGTFTDLCRGRRDHRVLAPALLLCRFRASGANQVRHPARGEGSGRMRCGIVPKGDFWPRWKRPGCRSRSRRARRLLRPQDRLRHHGRDWPGVAVRHDSARLRRAGAVRTRVRRTGQQDAPAGGHPSCGGRLAGALHRDSDRALRG